MSFVKLSAREGCCFASRAETKLVLPKNLTRAKAPGSKMIQFALPPTKAIIERNGVVGRVRRTILPTSMWSLDLVPLTSFLRNLGLDRRGGRWIELIHLAITSREMFVGLLRTNKRQTDCRATTGEMAKTKW